MTLKDWKSTGQYFNYKGQQIFYQESAAKAEIILCVHGFPTASWDWNKVWATLAQDYHLIAPDMIGFGYSAKPKKYHYHIHDQADLHEALLQYLGVERCHILAHDYGDTVVQELLARFQERKKENQAGVHFQSICFLNGGLFPEMHYPRLIQKMLLSPFGYLLTPFIGRHTLQKNFNAIWGEEKPSEQEIDEFYELLLYNDGKGRFHQLIHYITDRRQHRERWVNALIHAHIPIRLIDGALDPVSGIHMAEYYQEIIPHADVVVLEKVGHYPQTEAPQAVLKHYQAFLKLI